MRNVFPILACLIVLFVYRPALAAEPVAVAEDFLTALDSRDMNRAYGLLSRGTQRTLSRAEFARQTDALISDLGAGSYGRTLSRSDRGYLRRRLIDVQSFTTRGGQEKAVVIFSTSYPRAVVTEHVQVTQEPGGWSVEGLDVRPGGY